MKLSFVLKNFLGQVYACHFAICLFCLSRRMGIVELLFAAACRKSVSIRNVNSQLSGEYLPENIPLLSKELLISENMPSCLCLMAQCHCASIARVTPDIKKTQQFATILKWSPTKVVVGFPSVTEGEKEETDVSREVVWISWEHTNVLLSRQCAFCGRSENRR